MGGHPSLGVSFGWLSYGSSMPDTAELIYNNETVYFAQPSLSQLVPGGSGPGALQPTLPGPNDTPNDPLALVGRNAPKRDIGTVLRYTAPAHRRCSSTF